MVFAFSVFVGDLLWPPRKQSNRTVKIKTTSLNLSSHDVTGVCVGTECVEKAHNFTTFFSKNSWPQQTFSFALKKVDVLRKRNLHLSAVVKQHSDAINKRTLAYRSSGAIKPVLMSTCLWNKLGLNSLRDHAGPFYHHVYQNLHVNTTSNSWYTLQEKKSLGLYMGL